MPENQEFKSFLIYAYLVKGSRALEMLNLSEALKGELCSAFQLIIINSGCP